MPDLLQKLLRWKWLSLPHELTEQAARITWIAPFLLHIERHEGLLLLTHQSIRIRQSGEVLEITGSNLRIASISDAEVMVNGEITGVMRMKEDVS